MSAVIAATDAWEMEDADDFLAQQRAKLAQVRPRCRSMLVLAAVVQPCWRGLWVVVRSRRLPRACETQMAQAQQVAEMNVGLATNLRERMDELEAMAAESNIPVVTEMTSWEAERRGVAAPAPAPPPSGGKELVLCKKCFDIPCACAGSAYAAAGGAGIASGGYSRQAGMAGMPRSPLAKSRPPASFYPALEPEPEPVDYGGYTGGYAGGYAGGHGGGYGGTGASPQFAREPSLSSDAHSRRGHSGGRTVGGTHVTEQQRSPAGDGQPVLCMVCFDTHCKCPPGGAGAGAPRTPRGTAALCPRCFDIPCSC
eukprot:COSAG02_NODE_987_length_15443_cov_8.132625_9_plen_311_part_00